MFSKINRKIFYKLYRYYCRKSLEQWTMILLTFLTSLWVLWSFFSVLGKIDEITTGSEYLATFWMIGLFQMFGMMQIMSTLVSRLVGYSANYSAGRRSWGHSNWKRNSTEDITVLHFTPSVDRETVILTKYAAAATFYFLIDFFFYVLPLVFYFILAGKISLLSPIALFLLLNGLVFPLVNFFLLVPYLFYLYEDRSFLSILLAIIFVIGITLSIYFFRETVLQYSLLFQFLSLPLSGLLGYLFFTLYRKKFLRRDLV